MAGDMTRCRIPRVMTPPFIDAEDIADVAVAALTEDGHAAQLYELTGPRLLTFAEAVEEIAKATGRQIRYVQVSPEQYASLLAGLVRTGRVRVAAELPLHRSPGRPQRPPDGGRPARPGPSAPGFHRLRAGRRRHRCLGRGPRAARPQRLPDRVREISTSGNLRVEVGRYDHPRHGECRTSR